MTNQRSLRLLLIEDDEDDYLITRDLLGDAKQLRCQLDWVSHYEQALDTIRRQEHDLYLVDYRLGAESGLDLIAAAQAENVQTPFILLTGQGDDELDAYAIDMGASDYLVKGQFDGRSLARSIRYALSRAQSRSALSDSQSRYRLLFDANPQPMYVFHRESLAFLAVNQKMLDVYGYSQEEFAGMTVLDIRPADERSRLLTGSGQLIEASPLAEDRPWVHSLKGGRQILVEVTWSEIDFNGLPAYLALVKDVTEQVRSQEQAQRKDQAFRQLLTDSRDAMLVVDAGNIVRYANPAAEQLLGESFAQLQEHHLDLAVTPGQLRECRVPLADGRTLDAEVQCSQSEWDGQQMRLLSLRDIGARIESEKQLRVLRRSLEATYNGALICDAQASDLPIIYANPAFERITGYSAAEVIGQNCRFLQGSERDQPVIDDIRQGLKEIRETHVVLRNFRKDGTPFWNALYIAPVPDEQGRITHFIGIQNDISEQKNFESQLAYNASHDVLTGLPNRSLLEDRLVQGCQISRRYQRSLAVMFIDLDGFKPINDSMGHSAGDQILVEVARRMNQQVRPGDTVARLGGDEFIVILPDLAREEDTLLVADRIIASIAQPYKVAGIEMHITASIGITLSDGTTEPPMALIQQADLAMYKAKQQGRNNYQWYTQDLNQRVNERVTLRNELQKAIEAEAFQLYYQPQIDGRSGRVVGYEALLRWQHSELGFISPAEFVPVAEDTGQIIPLSEWVLHTACREARALLDKGWSGRVMAVNISPIQFQRSGFVDTVRAVLEETGLPPELLELELTESVLLDNAERAIFVLHALKDLGVSLAIDDFGTGFSSLNYLKRLPIDKIKIDRSFVQEVISDSTDAAISLGIISMAHHLKLKVVAEGVETEPQYAFLKKNHCNEFQGFYFAKPMPLPLLEEFLRAQRDGVPGRLPLAAEDSNEQTLLLLDDEENILRALTRVLRRDGYRILTANRAQDAFALLAKHEVQVILSDQRMPEMNGTEFLSRVKDLYPHTIRIVLSGYTDLKSVTDAINQGAIYKFLTKPWDDEQLRATVTQAFQHHRLGQEKEHSVAPPDEQPS
ncbi:EAL domain-containing protein [Pseudomonas sp. LPB0260]|uniref:EAL domain-containing protein n=1 Tax=Pseudomonas sp. LPB0260 TaxID=2614442 RepID=UPI0015C278F8|nr:EAL domain-containing protein [Pseudomonas sp. LPB0260]QLC72184.1 EAL domain-containing protein [Pseudomonas sp. LPB0260]QLC74962.1 EAL domain-containing protein [Pseudomonas sp. LPB0260]